MSLFSHSYLNCIIQLRKYLIKEDNRDKYAYIFQFLMKSMKSTIQVHNAPVKFFFPGVREKMSVVKHTIVDMDYGVLWAGLC